MTDLKSQLKAVKPKGGKLRLRNRYPARVQRAYQAALQGMIKDINRTVREQIKSEIAATIRQDSTADVLRAIAALVDSTVSGEALARRIAEQVNASATGELNRAVERAIGINILGAGSSLSESLDAWIVENTSLIKDMQDTHVMRIQGTVSRGFRDGLTSGEISKQIQADTGITMRRAKLIARDQVGTLNAQITKDRDEELGVESYIWRTARDERVRGNPSGLYPNARPSHYAREGEEFKWSEPPSGGHAGIPVNCRCYAESVIEF